MEAAAIVNGNGIEVILEIMIPLVGAARELELLRQSVVEEAEKVCEERGLQLNYLVGTMIELPRAALMAKEIARHADFFSFGTNDLTQMTYGFSRDDIGSFLPTYLQKGVLPDSPLIRFDVEGVGQLVQIGTDRGRHSNARLKVGVCGEHAGDPHGIRFFHTVGLDYVSVSPFRVPVARLAAAHAALGVQI